MTPYRHGVCRAAEVYIKVFLTWTLDACRQPHIPAALPRGKDPYNGVLNPSETKFNLIQSKCKDSVRVKNLGHFYPNLDVRRSPIREN